MGRPDFNTMLYGIEHWGLGGLLPHHGWCVWGDHRWDGSGFASITLPFMNISPPPNQHDILDINDIFRDLGTMVHEQGDTIGQLAII